MNFTQNGRHRPSSTIGQWMGLFLTVSVLIALIASLLRVDAGSREAMRALLDALLFLPIGLLVGSAALASTTRSGRVHVIRFAGFGPMLYGALLYFAMLVASCFASAPLQVTNFDRARDGFQSVAYAIVVSLGYFGLLVALFPRRCPQCGEPALRRLHRVHEQGAEGPTNGVDYDCVLCGSGCRRDSEGRWEILFHPLERHADWVGHYLPRLRHLRGQMTKSEPSDSERRTKFHS